MKLKGGDYTSNLPGNRMRRRDYELNNMSFDNSRPFYSLNVSGFHIDSSNNDFPQPVAPPVDNKLDLLKRKVSHSLLTSKQDTSYTEGIDQSLIGGGKKNIGTKLKLPVLREKYTLHITNRGPKILASK